MTERQKHDTDSLLFAGEGWHLLSHEQGTAEAVDLIISAADRGISVKRVLRRMAASAPQYFGTTITFTWGTWEGDPITQGMGGDAFYAPLVKADLSHQGWMYGLEPLTDTCSQMMRHTIAMYEASSDPRVAIARLLTLQRAVGIALEHLSNAISRLVCDRISQEPLALEFSGVSWIRKCIELYEAGRKEESLDVIFDTFDEMLLV